MYSKSKERQLYLYDYQKTRSSSCAEEFLGGSSGYLQTDGYNKVKNIKRLYCMAHIKEIINYRKFNKKGDDAIEFLCFDGKSKIKREYS